MDYTKATDDQLKVIVESDGECPSSLLYPVLEEVVRRDLYKNYMIRVLNSRYKAIRYVEHLTKLSFDELKYLLYEQAFEALKHYKPGKNPFLKFWVNFMFTALNYETRKYRRKCRQGETVHIDDEKVFIRLVDDNNTERKAINRVLLGSLLQHINEKERFILLRRNDDYTFQEIANEIGYSREYVRKKHNEITNKLRLIAKGA